MKTRFIAVLAVLMLTLPFVGVLAQDSTITDIVVNSEDHTILETVVVELGLAETLATEELTVFAPTDAAFEALGIGAEDLLGMPELATTIVTYHVVPGTVMSTDLSNMMAPSLEGSELTINVSDMGVMVDQANVTAADLEASNGVVHVIDSVLLTLPVDPSTVEGDIAAAGSSTVFPLAERMKDEFEAAGYAGTLSIDSIGSGGGFQRFCEEGASDISNASRAIRDSEVEACGMLEPSREPIEIRVGTDALAVVTSTENDFVENLTLDELALVFGSAETWADVNPDFPAEPIERFIPDDASGTFDYFVEEVFEEDPEPIRSMNPVQSSDDNVLVEGIVASEFAIGFFGYAYFAENEGDLKALSIDGVEPNAANVDNGSYPLARPLFMYTDDDIIAEKPQVAAFLNFVVSDVNSYIGDVGYFPANPAALYGAKATLLQAELMAMGGM
jgi:phosphate transport system substrate-binding protein